VGKFLKKSNTSIGNFKDESTQIYQNTLLNFYDSIASHDNSKHVYQKTWLNKNNSKNCQTNLNF